MPQNETAPSIIYRPDIDGLRAVAVMAVVFYHAGSSWFSGGFVGVDVFFVVSGFLITTLIQKDIEQNCFSVISFYDRRVRRIFPALFFVLFGCYILSFILFTPDDFASFGKLLVATSLFASNIQLLRDSVYFDAPSQLKPLLHTWSLSVEEQFYIFFPLFLIAIQRWSKRSWRKWLVSLTLLSFIVGFLQMHRSSAAAFYLSPFRAWELLLGALVALNMFPKIESRIVREGMSLVGFTLVICGVIAFSSHTVFPGVNALVPTLGTALFIYAGCLGPTWIGRMLSLRPLVFVGLISYSLYLWHWPLLTFAAIWKVRSLTEVERLAVISISFLAAVASWRYIERPVRLKQVFVNRQHLFKASAVAMTLAVILGIQLWLTKGLPGRLPAQVVELSDARNDSNPSRLQCHGNDANPISFDKKCRYGNPKGKPSVAVWGDSFAAEISAPLGDLAQKRGQSIIQISYSSCPPSLGDAQASSLCERHNFEMFTHLIEPDSPESIVLSARYSLYGEDFLHRLRELTHKLSGAHKRVAIVYPVPEATLPVPTLLARYAMVGLDLKMAYISEADYHAMYDKTIAFLDEMTTNDGIIGIKPDQLLCANGRCAVESEGRPLYFDNFHLSMAGARYVAPLFEPVFPY